MCDIILLEIGRYWYSFLLMSELMTRPQCGEKLSIKTFIWNHWESMRRPSILWLSYQPTVLPHARNPTSFHPCSTSIITDILHPLQSVRRARRLQAVNIFFCISSSLMIFSSTSHNKGNSHALQTALVCVCSGYHKSILLAKRYTFLSMSWGPLEEFSWKCITNIR